MPQQSNLGAYCAIDMYIKTTHNIKITAVPVYLDKQSVPSDDKYVWSYTIIIENLGQDTVQLLSRQWRITNAHGQTQIVQGDGVIGEQPTIKASEKYQYTSGAALTTPSGIMVGQYKMVSHSNNEQFDVDIPAFSLDSPYQVVRSH